MPLSRIRHFIFWRRYNNNFLDENLNVGSETEGVWRDFDGNIIGTQDISVSYDFDLEDGQFADWYYGYPMYATSNYVQFGMDGMDVFWDESNENGRNDNLHLVCQKALVLRSRLILSILYTQYILHIVCPQARNRPFFQLFFLTLIFFGLWLERKLLFSTHTLHKKKNEIRPFRGP